MSVSDLAIVAALIFAWGTMSARLERFDVTAPIMFVIVGLVLTHGPLGVLGFAPSHEAVKVLAEVTLVLVLFSDASRVGLRDLRAELGLCLRLLGIGLPLTIVLGTLLALALFGGINIWLALLIGAALAPTDAGALVSLLVWLAFGAVAVAPMFEHLTWQLVVYAVLSLTVIRMIPVALALIGAKLGWPTTAFLGWFGPRGLASVVFALLALEDLGGKAAGPAVAVITATVLLSVIAHGISAEPLARRYGAMSARADTRQDSAALAEPEVPTRRLIRRAPGRDAEPVPPSVG